MFDLKIIKIMKLRHISKRNIVCGVLVINLLAALGGCAVNPVTGRNELSFVSPAQEVAIGKANYVPAQQAQGGQLALDPELTSYVREVGNRMARVSGVELPYEFVVLNNSVPNAWAMPGGKIAINRGLLTELKSEAELAAVLGHEVTHSAARHGARSQTRGILLQGAMVATAVVSSQTTEYAGALVGASQVAANLVSTKYGRDAERESDYYGTQWLAEAGYDPVAAVHLQETFVRLSEGRQSDWLSGLFSSHPPSQERVENNRAQVAQLRAEGKIKPDADLGERRYAQAMRLLNSRAPAYAKQDEARAALGGGDTAAALAAINRAIQLEPKEASFHGVRGDIRFQQKRWDDAATNYNRAIGYDDGYYHYYLGRGMANAQNGAVRDAKPDLERSLKLLPTTTAYSQLGKIAESEGNQDLALKYYAAAGESNSNAGAAARASYAALDVPRHPGQYVKTRVALNQSGVPVLLVQNASKIALVNVQVVTQLGWADGKTQRVERTIKQLAGGQQVQVALPNRKVPLQQQASSAVAAQPLSASR